MEGWSLEELGVTGLATGAAFAGALIFLAHKTQNAKRSSTSPTAMISNDFNEYRLVDKIFVSHNVRLFRFSLPSSTGTLGLPIGQHLHLQAQIEGETITRPYTPVSSDDDIGHFDLVVKIYEKGKMSSYLHSLGIGKMVRARGPLGRFSYEGDGVYSVSGRQSRRGRASRIGMLAGGTGITPMLQIIRAIMTSERDQTQVNLVFGNIEERDILLRDELDQYAELYASQFSCYHTLNNAPEKWEQGVGFISSDMIQSELPAPSDDSLVLVCGPPPFVKAMIKILYTLSFTKDMIYQF